MKKLLTIFLLIVLAISCNGPGDESTGMKVSTPSPEEVATRKAKLNERDKKEKKDRIDCNWGLDSNHFKKQKKRDEEFNIADSGQEEIRATRGKKPVKPPPTTDPLPPTPPPVNSAGGCIYLNFYGKTITGTSWNVSGDFTVGHSGFADPEIFSIKLGVAGHFNIWYVTVTMDENVFKSYPIGKKQEIILTEDNEWYGTGAGGVAYKDSYSWAIPAPAFVFTKLLQYGVHYNTEAATHEAGHTLGLRHQSDCSNGVVVKAYSNYKIMGNSYPLSPVGTWTIGTSSAACAIQDDVVMITAKLSKNPAIQ